jgi:acyl carrier protein
MTRNAPGLRARSMTDEPTLEEVRAIVTRIANRGEVHTGPDTPLTEGGLGLDSLNLLRTLLACEETFQVAFEPDTDCTDETLSTAGALFDLIRSKRAQ